MRGDHNVRKRREEVVHGRRLLLVNIEGRPGDLPLLEHLREDLVVHELRPGGVDEVGGRLHLLQEGPGDEALGLGVQGQVESHDIRGGEEFLDGDEAEAVLSPRRGVGPGPSEHGHADAGPEPRHVGADGAKPHDAEGLSFEVHPLELGG